MAKKEKEFDLTSDGVEESSVEQVSTSTQTPSKDDGAKKNIDLDPNDVTVTISDPSPVIILFGAKTSGKTMALIRLTRYLKQHKEEYKVMPDKTFRRSDSDNYEEMCDTFDSNVNSDYAAKGTHELNFMLVKVMNKWGEPYCQLLEAPGEHYFDEDSPKGPFPTYINKICNSKHFKTWVFIIEKDWKTEEVRRNYADKIKSMQSKIKSRDRVIFMCHKADKHEELFNVGVPNETQFFKEIKQQYPGIFDKYMNKNPMTKYVSPYNFDFVVFSAGTFIKLREQTTDRKERYEQGDDKFPAKFWKAIKKTVKGGF
jgi:hypothetical protein